MSAEAGEFTEIVKKMIFQGKPYNDDNKKHLLIELGDVMWYVMQACAALGVSLDEVVIQKTPTNFWHDIRWQSLTLRSLRTDQKETSDIDRGRVTPFFMATLSEVLLAVNEVVQDLGIEEPKVDANSKTTRITIKVDDRITARADMIAGLKEANLKQGKIVIPKHQFLVVLILFRVKYLSLVLMVS